MIQWIGTLFSTFGTWIHTTFLVEIALVERYVWWLVAILVIGAVVGVIGAKLNK